MHFQVYHGILGLRPETSVEDRRNHILRVRCGEITSYGKPIKSERRKSRTRYGTNALNDFVVVGQTVSTYMRLPNISHDIPIHKRNHTTGKTERASDTISATVDVRPLADNIELGEGYARHFKNLQEDHKAQRPARNPALTHSRSIDVRLPRTAPIERTEQPFRRWSDGGSSFSGTLSDSFQPFNKALARSLTLSSRSLNIVKSDPCVTQSPEELLSEFREFAKQRDMHRDEASVHSVRVLRSLGTPRTDSAQLAQRLLEKSTTRQKVTKEVSLTSKRQRRKTTKQPLQRQKRRGLMMPSGDSSRNKNTTHDKFYPSGTGNSGTMSTLSFRRGSRMVHPNRESSILRKFETNDAKSNRRSSVSIAAVARSGPSVEDLQELQEVPVIRKFLRMPNSRPKVVCFDYPGVDLTHMDVKKAIQKVLPDAFETGKVVSIQFENVNVKLATAGMDNRWYIELHDFSTRNKLIKNGLVIDRPDRNSITDMKIKVPKWAQDHGANDVDPKDELELILPAIHYPRNVQVKLNDAVSMEEYKLFLRRTAATEKLQNVALLCAGRGDKLLTTMI